MTTALRGVRRIDHADLRSRNTFGIGARAPVLFEVDDTAALPALFDDPAVGSDAMLIGSGSNLLFAGDPPHALISLTCRAIHRVSDEGDIAIIRADAGADWHDVVMWSLQQGLSGLQNLALIPGTAGAAPIQNIGAYGVEVCDAIHVVEAWHRREHRLVRLDRDACRFGYRDSRFKHEPDAWVVTAVEYALSTRPTLTLDYAGLREELAAMQISAPTARDVADAVIRIRRRKLPDPARVGNAGSFFKNPIVADAQADALLAAHPSLPVFRGDRSGTRKLSAAWLIDQGGWKGHREGDAGVSDGHALVLVNHGNATGAQLLALARRIAASVSERFGVAIEPEPRIVGAAW